VKRRWLFLFAVFVAAVLAAGWMLVPFDAPKITQANCDQIQIGSSEDEVAELLGRPKSRLKVGPSTAVIWKNVTLPGSYTYQQWNEHDRRFISVVFDEQGRVTDKRFTVISFAEQIKRRLRATWP
jgi:hypothetical protein